VAGIKVLDDHDRRRKVGGQVGQDPAEGANAPGRSGHGDHIEGRARKRPGDFRQIEIVRVSSSPGMLDQRLPSSGPCYNASA